MGHTRQSNHMGTPIASIIGVYWNHTTIKGWNPSWTPHNNQDLDAPRLFTIQIEFYSSDVTPRPFPLHSLLSYNLGKISALQNSYRLH